MSAVNHLKHIATTHKTRLIGTFSLVALENILMVTYPLFGSFAIDGVVNGNLLQALSYAALVLVIWTVGSARRAVDTRTFTRIYAEMVTDIISREHRQKQHTSTITARVALSREFVDFFEQHLPMIITSLFNIIGAVVMLLFIETYSGITALIILLIFSWALPSYTKINDRLYFRLNNRLEKDVIIIEQNQPYHTAKHYSLLSKFRIKISNREASSYLIIGVAMAILFGVTLTLLTTKGATAGHIYAVISYLWGFAMSLDDAPSLVEQLSQIKDIGKRISLDDPNAADDEMDNNIKAAT
ncbi:hypothetical protein B0181_11205 [Moraxella caviae]|uniref:ABC transmembrane type-1 domain-containing protein n=1 Tax=Moraxella caviae TaxID=34060 RepID=A0A1S9ZU84_9GAMM|nr:ABC transporter six-transmembrane domain-containing protein [Moraxella caviae]OOR87065.1 hypothetical protein B0181_11205 [Moraxella caviae]STZ13805.1 Uncharacterised protein [Moraxella caviae]VEW10177.1 Uncharacterised protein [Moraxella caviae]VEW10618.1 Uncharacterised protein [Moraxella caviae]